MALVEILQEHLSGEQTLAEKSLQTRLAADIGGTFTDIVLETPNGLFTAKIPTHVEQPELGVLSGVDVVLAMHPCRQVTSIFLFTAQRWQPTR